MGRGGEGNIHSFLDASVTYAMSDFFRIIFPPSLLCSSLLFFLIHLDC